MTAGIGRGASMMNSANTMQRQKQKYLRLLAEKYPTKEAVYADLINLQASLCLPKSVEHFVSDLHGEYELFYHILNNCSGVIKEKVDYVFGARLTAEEKAEFCTLIYYPVEKIQQMEAERRNTPEWYRENLSRLLEVSKLMTYKYPLTKVKSFIPQNYRSVITELFNTHPEADRAQFLYSKRLLNMIVQVGGAADFIVALTSLIKCLAVGHMHIIGDFFDRGNRPDTILDMVRDYHSLDIQWGNHDILWMGAACGQLACIATVIRIAARYGSLDTLEDGYGINLIPLATFALDTYSNTNCDTFSIKYNTDYNTKDLSLDMKIHKAIAIMQFKLEGQVIMKHPEFLMDDRLLLDKIDYEKKTVMAYGKEYPMNDTDFPTIDPKNPYALTPDEEQVMERIRQAFLKCEKLQKHVRFLYSNGGLYKVYNSNLLYHGCMPMDGEGNFLSVDVDGKDYQGKQLYDILDNYARKGYYAKNDPAEMRKAQDYIWYIWAGPNSPVFGKDKMTTFERYFIEDKETHKETKNAYYSLLDHEDILNKILDEFELDTRKSHIVNGHVPVELKKWESPIKCDGKLLIIDGGFSKAYQSKTGIAGYTLVANSHGMRLVAHEPFESMEAAVLHESDIFSDSTVIEVAPVRIRVSDTDIGRELKDQIKQLELLLQAYRDGIIVEK